MTKCFHCHLPIPKGIALTVQIQDELKQMCCIGCQAVAQMIVESGLDDFYTFREKPATSLQERNPESLNALARFNTQALENANEIVFIVDGMHCAACAWLIESRLQHIPGIQAVNVNITTQLATLHITPGTILPSQLIFEMQHLGFNAYPYHPDKAAKQRKRERIIALKRLGLSGIGFMQVMMYAISLYIGAFQGITHEYLYLLRLVSLTITTPIVIYCGKPFFHAAARALKVGRMNIDLAISLAVTVSYGAGLYATFTNRGEIYFDSVAMLIFLLTLTRYFEMSARHQGNYHLDTLQCHIPQFATRVSEPEQQTILQQDIALGDILLVKPGETIPTDGIVLSGESHVSEMLLTGESTPIAKKPGSTVLGGSQNHDNAFSMRVTSVGSTTVLSQIIHLLQTGQIEKPKMIALADKVASTFVSIIILSALCALTLWWQTSPEQAIWIMISILVISCPCALSIAMPLALAISTNRLSAMGYLITKPHVLHTLTQITDVVFDKTGTLTFGNLRLIDIHFYTSTSEAELMRIACSLEAHSTHPVAKAFTHYRQDKGCAIQLVKDVQSQTHEGLSGVIEGVRYFIGKPSYIQKHCAMSVEAIPYTTLLCDPLQILAGFTLQDSLRPDAKQCAQALTTRGLTLHITTGDPAPDALAIGETLGITQGISSASPERKCQYIQQLQATGAKVAMIGDGINDIPILSVADVSIATGSGCDLAKIHADAILLNDDLMGLSQGFAVARDTHRVVSQNISWALIYNLIAIPIACAGVVAPYLAVIGMSLSSLVVVCNALRLRRA